MTDEGGESVEDALEDVEDPDDEEESEDEDGIPIEDLDIEALRVTREESRAMLDHQIALLNDIDDKVMRTVRTGVILTGLAVSALSVGGAAALESAGTAPLWLAELGVVALVVAVVHGIATYTVSEVTYGIGNSYRIEIQNSRHTEREWLVKLLDGYSEWIGDIRAETDQNANLLSQIQLLLLTGILFLSLAGGILVSVVVFGVPPGETMLSAVLFGTTSLLLWAVWKRLK